MVLQHKIHPSFEVSSATTQECPKAQEAQAGLVQLFLGTYRALAVLWYRSQIGNRHDYSVDRMLAFQGYHDRTSLARVVVVCIFYPIPAFLIVFLIECIPLADPAEGWKANRTLWIAAIQAGVISNARTIGTAVAAAIYYTSMSLGLAATWKFPILFGLVVMVLPYELFTNGVFIFGIGMIARVSLHFHERVGSLIVFTVDVFNVIYVSMCMQTAQSVLTTILRMASDLFHLLLALRTIYYVTNAIKKYCQRASTLRKSRYPVNYLEGMPAMVRSALDEAQISQILVSEMIQVFAPFKLVVSSESTNFLAELATKTEERGIVTEVTSKPKRGGPALTMIPVQVQDRTSISTVIDRTKGPSPQKLAPTRPSSRVGTNGSVSMLSSPAVPPRSAARASSMRKKSSSAKSISHTSSSRSLLVNLRRASLVPFGAPVLDSKSTEDAACRLYSTANTSY
ncbi:hypothetical protein ON010_g16081 [Phytophthora cinnamomi]|nr:hypothetical protein ON010_g16081 [Phytophthora cinnamomi]